MVVFSQFYHAKLGGGTKASGAINFPSIFDAAGFSVIGEAGTSELFSEFFFIKVIDLFLCLNQRFYMSQGRCDDAYPIEFLKCICEWMIC